jgi:hypothetical protein
MVGIQLAEAVIAGLNAGIYALGNWTFTDYPDSYRDDYTNRWGTFEWEGDRRTRPHYYAYGLLTRFFRGPSESVAVQTDDPLIRSGAVRHPDGSWSIAVVSRRTDEARLSLHVDGEEVDATFRRYAYDPEDVPQHALGDLQPHEAEIGPVGEALSDSIRPGTLVVYTTGCSDGCPGPVEGVTTERVEGGIHVEWQANPEPDICYYRVYRSSLPDFTPSEATRIGSTVTTTFNDGSLAAPASHYKVVAVNESGNAGSCQGGAREKTPR